MLEVVVVGWRGVSRRYKDVKLYLVYINIFVDRVGFLSWS